jgi:hypothetical protein
MRRYILRKSAGTHLLSFAPFSKLHSCVLQSSRSPVISRPPGCPVVLWFTSRNLSAGRFRTTTQERVFQVTSGQHRSSPACTALSIVLRSAGRFASRLHENRFRRLPLHRLEARRVHLHNRTVCSRRRFPRPQRFPLTRIPFRGQRSPPDASLTHDPANFTRSAFWLRDPPLVRPSGRRHPRLRPVALLPVRSSGRAANLHSPLGVFARYGSQRSMG